MSTEVDPLDEKDRDGGALEEVSDEDLQIWAERYEELNGAPENDDDR